MKLPLMQDQDQELNWRTDVNNVAAIACGCAS